MPIPLLKPADHGMEVDRAIEVFVHGFAFTRSFTHPTAAHRVGGMWVVRDDPRKRAADYRREEWVPHAMNASEVDAIARRETRGHFCICAICGSDEPEAPLRAAYKALD